MGEKNEPTQGTAERLLSLRCVHGADTSFSGIVCAEAQN